MDINFELKNFSKKIGNIFRGTLEKIYIRDVMVNGQSK